ncbi:MAG: hypothetical protein AMXMBFR64_13310 [Myxococcales bacterium]
MGARQAAVHIAVAVIALGLAVALVLWRLDRDPWGDAAAHVRERIAPGELVVLHPSFHFREVRAFAGLPVVAGAPLHEARRFPGVWVVSAEPLPGSFRALDSALGASSRATVGPLEVHHWPGGNP